MHSMPIGLRPSHQLAFILIVAHAATAALLWMLGLPVWLAGAATLLLLVSAAHSVRHHALRRGPHAITTLAFSDREAVRITVGDGRSCRGQVLDSSMVGVRMTILNIALDGRRRRAHVILLADSLDADDFRRLRVWLRWGPQAVVDESAV